MQPGDWKDSKGRQTSPLSLALCFPLRAALCFVSF